MCSGFMLKDAPPEEIAAAVRIVASGEALLAPAGMGPITDRRDVAMPCPLQPGQVPGAGPLHAYAPISAAIQAVSTRDMRSESELRVTSFGSQPPHFRVIRWRSRRRIHAGAPTQDSRRVRGGPPGWFRS
jgi:hypothetical protein